ncbi:hypothetical protein DL771_011146 [Monosporascus sp. 5C6A]|nr:hypothetical protein DL771_011146 [Monosporascus sp. 5C6A]
MAAKFSGSSIAQILLTKRALFGRPLNVRTRNLEDMIEKETPRYAILSHIWGQAEITFQDLSGLLHRRKAGYVKIEECYQQAGAQERAEI